MKNINTNFQQLFEQYLDGHMTSNDFQKFLTLLKEVDQDHLSEDLTSLWETSQSEQFSFTEEVWNDKMTRLIEMTKETSPSKSQIKKSYVLLGFYSWGKAAAAILILAIVGGAFWFIHNNKADKKEDTISTIGNQLKHDVAPGGNKAILTLADGSTIILDNAQNGALATQGNIAVVKKNNQLIYDASKSVPDALGRVLFNTIATPRGGQYQITLPDGSKVWLNAASSIKFPTIFRGKERKVEITGEAYFEVAHNAKMPFLVEKDEAEVRVLGTHFNVNAYTDENAMKVTLLEGSVKVIRQKTNESKIISPGQQAQLLKSGTIKIEEVDAEETVAWKKGYFHFDHADIKTVMRQLSYWYDVDIIYEGSIPTQQFGGDMQRDLTLSQVLNILGKSQVKFKIEGKKIIISH
jgi:ferric-dicitrate binding protein FerR (iron transport regulator)